MKELESSAWSYKIDPMPVYFIKAYPHGELNYLYRAFYFPVVHRNRKHSYSHLVRDEFKLGEIGDIEMVYVEGVFSRMPNQNSVFNMGAITYSEIVENYVPPPVNMEFLIKEYNTNDFWRKDKSTGKDILNALIKTLDNEELFVFKNDNFPLAMKEEYYQFNSNVVDNLIEHILPQVFLRKIPKCKYFPVKLDKSNAVRAISFTALVWASAYQSVLDEENKNTTAINNVDITETFLFNSLLEKKEDVGLTKEEYNVLQHINNLDISLYDFSKMINDMYSIQNVYRHEIAKSN